jgi:transposase
MRLAGYLGGMFTPAKPLFIDDNQRKRLAFLARSHKTPQQIATRARIILLAADGTPNNAIAAQVGVSRPTVLLWRARFERLGVPGLMKERKRPGRPPKITPEKVKAVVEATMRTTPEDATQWSVRTMAAAQGVSATTIHRIWRQHRLQPHRVETFKFSKDPLFVEKLRDIVGLYLNPPEHALILSYDEKTQIQALDRTQPGLPLKKGRCGTMTHDYKRHGTTTLFAALNVLDGTVIGECMPRHRTREFLKFLRRVDTETPADLDLHVVLDNLNVHKSPPVKRWLKRHPRFHFHFTPTGSSWLNLVERWFNEITRKRIRRGVFHSVADLIAAIEDYLSKNNANPKPFTWTKDADTILAKIERCKASVGTLH